MTGCGLAWSKPSATQLESVFAAHMLLVASETVFSVACQAPRCCILRFSLVITEALSRF